MEIWPTSGRNRVNMNKKFKPLSERGAFTFLEGYILGRIAGLQEWNKIETMRGFQYTWSNWLMFNPNWDVSKEQTEAIIKSLIYERYIHCHLLNILETTLRTASLYESIKGKDYLMDIPSGWEEDTSKNWDEEILFNQDFQFEDLPEEIMEKNALFT